MSSPAQRSIIDLLLEYKANIDYQTPEGKTVLMILAEKDDFDMVSFLLERERKAYVKAQRYPRFNSRYDRY
jgi:ankyrin repeat protein